MSPPTAWAKKRPSVARPIATSQGAATASRWLSEAAFRPRRLVLWAGALPEDMDWRLAQQTLRGLSVTVVVGNQDEYITAEKVQAHLELLRQLGSEPTLLRFAGRHALQADVLRQLHP